MTQTYIITAAAIHFVVVASIVTTGSAFYSLMFKAYPIVLAFGLGCIAVARFMGWPL